MTVLRFIVLMFKGAAIGAANVVPGVSGGTIALISGIFEELITSIKSINWQFVRLLVNGDFRKAFSHLNGLFLCALGIGLFASIFTLAKLLTRILFEHKALTLSFFWGLILASVFLIGRKVPKWTPPACLALLAGIAGAATILFIRPPLTSNTDPIYIFLCGGATISAMILPGISGSFILILMGNYSLLLNVTADVWDYNTSLPILFPFAAGCVTGLILFSRVLAFILQKWHHTILSLLTGFVIGSLPVIWPWKIGGYSDGYKWNLPTLDQQLLLAVLLMLAGAGLVLMLDFFAQNKPKPEKTPRE